MFNNFRDIFYELLREWEDKHMIPGWTVKNSQTDRIRGLVHYAGTDLSNHLHLVRLFLLQLIQVVALFLMLVIVVHLYVRRVLLTRRL